MARKAKEFDATYKFSERFTQLCGTEVKPLKEWGELFGVTRQTITNWQMKDASPDIIKLTAIAKYFDVSTDYLLGLSDTMSPDINARAAVEYTGLSEAAVEKLNIGIVDSKAYGARLNPQKKNDYSRIASEFICSSEFKPLFISKTKNQKVQQKMTKKIYNQKFRYTAIEENK